MGEEEIKLDTKKFNEFVKRNKYRIIAISMFIFAVSGMLFCWKAAYIKGAATICENSDGIPILKNTQDIKKAQCLIEYDPLSLYNNNLGLEPEDIERLKGMR